MHKDSRSIVDRASPYLSINNVKNRSFWKYVSTIYDVNLLRLAIGIFFLKNHLFDGSILIYSGFVVNR